MRIALIGNPNVGKSLIFTQLTGVGVEISNYPGTTIAMKSGATCVQRDIHELADLPGIYTLDGTSEEEVLVRQEIVRGGVDAAIVVMDATHLERNLYLFLQLAETGLPLIAVVNMIDEAEAMGLRVDTDRLSALLGVEVIAAAAIKGRNISDIMPLATRSSRPAAISVPYDNDVEAAIRSLGKTMGASRVQALWALQGIGGAAELQESGKVLAGEIEPSHRMTIHQIIAANRHHLAQRLAAQVVGRGTPARGWNMDRLLLHAWPGIPILLFILGAMLLSVFLLGSFMETAFTRSFEGAVMGPVSHAGLPPLAATLAMSILLAIQAGLGIAFPFVFLFSVLLSVLEDTGYMTRAAFLADRAMHRVGLHGGAVIPLILSFGCNVPAVMAIRTLRTRRERTIAAFLVTMVPCSARTVIIAGMVAAFIGIAAAFSIYLVVAGLTLATGILISRLTPGEQFGMILEISPLRWPDPKLVVVKSWHRVRDFIFIAFPVLLAGSIVLGLADYTGVLAFFQASLAPYLQSVLGLPPYAATALVFGILRKEMAFETLVVLAGTANLPAVMMPLQIYTFALISVLFVPCVSTIAVLSREVGYRVAFAVSAYTVALGIAIGAVLHLVAG
jgi:ferrous iron transport protein B